MYVPNRKYLKLNLPHDRVFVMFNLKATADNESNAAKMEKTVSKEFKTLLEKEKMLVTNIFSFSHNVFQTSLFQGC